MRLCLLLAVIGVLFGSANAAVDEWSSIHPSGPASGIGGPVIKLGYAESGEAYLLSYLGRLHKRTAIDQPWVPMVTSTNLGEVRLSDLHIGPGDPAVLLGEVDYDRLVRSTDGGANWVELDLPTTGTGFSGAIASFATAASDPNLIYYLVRYEAWQSSDGGLSWQQRGASGPQYPNDLEVHPFSPSTLYTLSEGDMFKSIDEGQSWFVMNNGMAPDFNSRGFALDAGSPQSIYVGGWQDAYNSGDAGANWSLLPTAFIQETIRDLAVDPLSPATVYAAAESNFRFNARLGSLYRSADSGATWTRMAGSDESGIFLHVDVSATGEVLAGGRAQLVGSSDGVSFSTSNAGFNDFFTRDLAVAPSNENVMYASGIWGGVIATFDGGQTWANRNNGIGAVGVWQIAVDHGDPMHAYAAANYGFYETTDGGQSWQELDLGGEPWWAASSVKIAPTDPDRLYIRVYDLMTSADGGETWSAVLDESTFWLNGVNYPVVIPADDAMTVYVGTYDQGLLKSTDAGATWMAITDGLPTLFVNSIALDPANSQRIVLGLNSNIVVESLDGGVTWADITANLPDGLGLAPVKWVAIDHFTGSTYALLGFPAGVYQRNADGGQWEEVGSAVSKYSEYAQQLIPSTETRGRLFMQAQELFVFDLDTDGDGIADGADNCINAANADQRDTDGDGIGNLCDADVNGPGGVDDCLVNFLDLLTYRQNFFVMDDLDTDNNGDNITNFLDLLVVRQQFFGPPGPSANGCD